MFLNLPEELQIKILKMNPHPCCDEIWIKSSNLVNMSNRLLRNMAQCFHGVYDMDFDKVKIIMRVRKEIRLSMLG